MNAYVTVKLVTVEIELRFRGIDDSPCGDCFLWDKYTVNLATGIILYTRKTANLLY